MSTDALNVLLFYIATIFCILFIFFFLYVVIKKSPPTLRSYRNNLLNLTVWYLADLFSFGILLQPVLAVHEKRLCARCYGLAVIFSDKLVHVAGFASIIFSCNVGAALLLSSFFRFIQLAHPGLSNWFTHSTYGTAACVLWHLAATVGSGILAFVMFVFGDDLNLGDSFLLCFDVQTNHVVLGAISFAAAVLMLFGCFVCVFMFLSIRVLQRQRYVMSNKTYRLQMLLTFNLVILTVLPVVFEVIPIIITFIAVNLNLLPYLYTIVSIATHVPFIEVMLTCCATLGFVTPYRRAIRGVICLKQTKAGISVSPSGIIL